MQLFNFFKYRSLADTNVNEYIYNALQDISINVKLQDDFYIHHPNHKPFELPAETVNHLKRMPVHIQEKYRGMQLSHFLYSVYYNGSKQNILASKEDSNFMLLGRQSSNLQGMNLDFYNRLHKNNRGEGYFDSGWHVLREERDGSLAVTKNSLRLHVVRDRHLQQSEKTAIAGDSVAIRMPKNLIQNGFYVAVGNLGLNNIDRLDGQRTIVRIYFNLTPEGAVKLMSQLTRQLNEISINFKLKVLYDLNDYGRYDSGVLYFEKRDYHIVQPIIRTTYYKNQANFQPEIPLFTKYLAPGVGLAEEPNHKFMEQESFGMNRCQIVADGLLEAWKKKDDSPEGRINAILQSFLHFGINYQRAYLNSNSEDVYAELS